MKKILLAAAFMLLAVSSFAQDGRSIYNKYSDSKGVSAVYISPAMFRLIGHIPDLDLGGGDVNLTSVIQSLDGMYLIDSENADINGKIKSDAEKFVRSGKYEMLMEVKEDGEVVHMYTSGDEKVVTSFVMIAAEPGECTFICLDGKLSRKELEDLVADAAR